MPRPTAHAMSLPRTCIDCDAPVGSDLRPLQDCWYWGQVAERLRRQGKDDEYIRDWMGSGADPPCECNAYTLWSQRHDRKDMLIMIGIPFVMIAGLIALIFGVK